MENYKNVSQDIRDQLNAEAKAVEIILTGIDNDIYSTVDACPNACKMWKAIERANQDNSPRINRGTGYDNQRIGNVAGARENVEQADWRDDTDDEPEDHELEAHYIENLEQSKSVNDTYPIKQDEHNVIIDSLDMRYDREQGDQDDDDDLANERDLLASLIEKLKCEIDDSKNRNKFLETSNKALVDKQQDDEMSKDKEIDKLMALISLSFNKIYKPTNNNLRTSSNTSRANQDNSPRINRGTRYDNQRIGNVTGARENVEQADWRDDTDDEPEDQELEAHYMYMAQIQEVNPDDADNS
nr:hypothetical protein [Tanacetum cinerariifolium]